jgi:membrane protease YdiL (CAAX protease family)
MAAHALARPVTDRPDPPHAPREPREARQPGEEPEARFLLAAGTIVYVLMAAGALAWLAWRDRMAALPELAIGARGMCWGAGIGLAVGWLGARMFAVVNPRLPRMREFEATARRSFARTSDGAAIAFVLVGAVGEELFFRLAVQDALGLSGSVAIAVGLNSTLGGITWLPFALLHALALGLMVQQGLGLLGSTTASAIMNYLNLRRIQCSSS